MGRSPRNLLRFQLPALARLRENGLKSLAGAFPMVATRHFEPPSRSISSLDPAVWAEAELLALKGIAAKLPEYDSAEADELASRIHDCEIKLLSKPARTDDGLIAQLDLFRSWIAVAAPEREKLRIAIEAVTAGLRDWVREV